MDKGEQPNALMLVGGRREFEYENPAPQFIRCFETLAY